MALLFLALGVKAPVVRVTLFVAYGLDGVETGCLLGGIPAEENAGEGAYGEAHDDAPRLYLRGDVEEGVEA